MQQVLVQQVLATSIKPNPAASWHFLQACYRAAKAAYNLKQYSKAIALAAQGLSKDTSSHELEQIQQVTVGNGLHS